MQRFEELRRGNSIRSTHVSRLSPHHNHQPKASTDALLCSPPFLLSPFPAAVLPNDRLTNEKKMVFKFRLCETIITQPLPFV